MLLYYNENLARTPRSNLTAPEQLRLLKTLRDANPELQLWPQLRSDLGLIRILDEMGLSDRDIDSAEVIEVPGETESEPRRWPRTRASDSKFSLVIQPLRGDSTAHIRYWSDPDTVRQSLQLAQAGLAIVNTDLDHTLWNYGRQAKKFIYLHISWGVSLKAYELVNTDQDQLQSTSSSSFSRAVGPHTAEWLNRSRL